MDREALIELILKGVLSKLEEMEESSSVSIKQDNPIGEERQPLSCQDKDNILIVTGRNKKGCEFLKDELQIKEAYQLVSTADSGWDICPRNFDLVVFTGATNTDISKLSAGIFDEPHLELISNAVMAGKKIALLTDWLEYLAYSKEEPAAFRAFFNERLAALRRWGIDTITCHQLTSKLISEIKSQEETHEIKGLDLRKSVITEKDVRFASESGHRHITIGKKSIVSDMAKEFAERNKITFFRSGEDR